MTHGGIPSLISLDPTFPSLSGDSSFRRWVVGSLVLHLVVAFLALNLRFSPTIEQPLSSFEVSLVSLPAQNAPTPSRSNTKPVTRKPKRVPSAAKPKAKPVPPPPKPQEKALPPLTTKMAPERLSESFSGAAQSVAVPDKLAPEALPEPPVAVKTASGLPTALENVQLPSENPSLTPVQPFAPRDPVTIPDLAPKSPPKPEPVHSETPARKILPPSKVDVQETLKEIKSPPKAPTLTPVQPFTKSQELEVSSPPHDPISQSLKEKIQSVQVPTQPRKIVKKPKKPTKTKMPVLPPPTPVIPKAPELAKAAPQKREEPLPVKPRERLSDSLKDMLESVKVPHLRDVSKPTPVQPPASAHRSPTPIKPDRESVVSRKLRTEIDQQLAKLKVPDVASIESVRTRLEVQADTPGDSESELSGATAQSSQSSNGQNRYLAMVQTRIDQQWVAPPVKTDEKYLQVVLKFRILRSGNVMGLSIVRGSGNTYYDSAAKRAVQAADPLPPFPSDLSNAYFDVRYNFTLGEPSS